MRSTTGDKPERTDPVEAAQAAQRSREAAEREARQQRAWIAAATGEPLEGVTREHSRKHVAAVVSLGGLLRVHHTADPGRLGSIGPVDLHLYETADELWEHIGEVNINLLVVDITVDEPREVIERFVERGRGHLRPKSDPPRVVLWMRQEGPSDVALGLELLDRFRREIVGAVRHLGDPATLLYDVTYGRVDNMLARQAIFAASPHLELPGSLPVMRTLLHAAYGTYSAEVVSIEGAVASGTARNGVTLTVEALVKVLHEFEAVEVNAAPHKFAAIVHWSTLLDRWLTGIVRYNARREAGRRQRIALELLPLLSRRR